MYCWFCISCLSLKKDSAVHPMSISHAPIKLNSAIFYSGKGLAKVSRQRQGSELFPG